MKAHELAKKLLKLPDFEVLICGDTASLSMKAECSGVIGVRLPQTKCTTTDGTVEMVVIIDLLEE